MNATTKTTVYVRSSQQPDIYVKSGNSELCGEWPGSTMLWKANIDGTNMWYYEIESDNFTAVFSYKGDGWNNRNQTADITVSGDTYYEMDFTDGEGDPWRVKYTLMSNTTIAKAELRGDFNNWGNSGVGYIDPEMTSGGNNTYTYTVDLSSTSDAKGFKFLPNGNWLGVGSNVIIDAPEGWIDGDNNWYLQHSRTGFNTYMFTATWTENPYATYLWNLKIEGVTQRVYSIVGMEKTAQGDGWSRDWDMTATETAGEYKVVKEFEIPSAGTYQYKLRANHAWSIYELPSSENATYEFKDAGNYRLTFIANIINNTVSLSAEKIVQLGASGKGTFASNHVCDFSNVEGLTAYAVSEISNNSAKLTQVTGVPNGNGVILIGSSNGKYYVPFGSAQSLGCNNLLKAVTSADGYTVANNGDAFILYTDGLFHPANAGTIPFGKAYLLKEDVGNAPALSLDFDDETTGINAINSSLLTNDVYYDLQGRRVIQPTKGIYIVNGKKVVIK